VQAEAELGGCGSREKQSTERWQTEELLEICSAACTVTGSMAMMMKAWRCVSVALPALYKGCGEAPKLTIIPPQPPLDQRVPNPEPYRDSQPGESQEGGGDSHDGRPFVFHGAVELVVEERAVAASTTSRILMGRVIKGPPDA